MLHQKKNQQVDLKQKNYATEYLLHNVENSERTHVQTHTDARPGVVGARIVVI